MKSVLFWLMVMLFSVTTILSANDFKSFNSPILEVVGIPFEVSFPMTQVETTIVIEGRNSLLICTSSTNNMVSKSTIGTIPFRIEILSNHVPVVVNPDLEGGTLFHTGFKRWADHPDFLGIA